MTHQRPKMRRGTRSLSQSVSRKHRPRFHWASSPAIALFKKKKPKQTASLFISRMDEILAEHPPPLWSVRGAGHKGAVPSNSADPGMSADGRLTSWGTNGGAGRDTSERLLFVFKTVLVKANTQIA